MKAQIMENINAVRNMTEVNTVRFNTLAKSGISRCLCCCCCSYTGGGLCLCF